MESTQQPLISIILAVRNDERFLRETLATVAAQTYPNLELVILDGASTDRTLDIIKEYAARHNNVTWRSEPDKGQWDALEKGFRIAKGDYIAMLCGQDGYLRKDWYEQVAGIFAGHPEISLVWGVPFNMSEDGRLLGPHYAYAGFLNDKEYNERTRPMSTMAAKINWGHKGSIDRLKQMLGKLTWSRLMMVLDSLRTHSIPQKEDWFFYWVKTGRLFPDGNMCIRKDVFLANTMRFPNETMTNSAILDFYYNFNTKGYLSYGLPIAASFGRSHAEGQDLRNFDAALTAKYSRRLEEFRKGLKEKKSMTFIDPVGGVVLEREL